MACLLHSSCALPLTYAVSDQCGGFCNDDILVVHQLVDQVLWYSAGGIRLIRKYSLKTRPIDAKFCFFDSSTEASTALSDNGRINRGTHTSRKNAIAILLANGDALIYLFNGELSQIHLSYPVSCMISTPFGLLFQRQPLGCVNTLLFYGLSHPSAPLTAVETDCRYV